MSGCRSDAGGHKTISLIIPSAASGLVIGRGGENVRNIAQRSGSRVQLAGKESQIQGLNERIVSLTGAMESNVLAAVMVLQLLAQDASGKYDHLSTNYKAFQHTPYLSGLPHGMMGGHDHAGYPYGTAQAPAPLARGMQTLPGHAALGLMGSPHGMGMAGKTMSLNCLWYRACMSLLSYFRFIYSIRTIRNSKLSWRLVFPLE
jgi:hypothetical protein